MPSLGHSPAQKLLWYPFPAEENLDCVAWNLDFHSLLQLALPMGFPLLFPAQIPARWMHPGILIPALFAPPNPEWTFLHHLAGAIGSPPPVLPDHSTRGFPWHTSLAVYLTAFTFRRLFLGTDGLLIVWVYPVSPDKVERDSTLAPLEDHSNKFCYLGDI